jgi:hypothetical protein
LSQQPTPPQLEKVIEKTRRLPSGFDNVRGQELAKRAVKLAAARNHNPLAVGSITPFAPRSLSEGLQRSGTNCVAGVAGHLGPHQPPGCTRCNSAAGRSEGRFGGMAPKQVACLRCTSRAVLVYMRDLGKAPYVTPASTYRQVACSTIGGKHIYTIAIQIRPDWQVETNSLRL